MSSTDTETRNERRTKRRHDPAEVDSEETNELNVDVTPSVTETPRRETRKRKMAAESTLVPYKSKETERILKKVKRPSQTSQSKKSPRKGKELVVAKKTKTTAKKGKAIQTVIAKEDNQKKGMREIKAELDCLKIRTCPRVLCELISSLNPAQMKVIVEMGFEELLHWDIKEIPQRLSYWLIENFHPNSSSIKIGEGKLINIRVADVEFLLGFSGEKTITGTKRLLNNPLVQEFLDQFSTMNEEGNIIVPDPKNVTPAKLAQKILDCEEPDDWFKRNFVVLFSTQVVECCACGGVNITLLDSVEDTSTIKNLDWASYMMDVLLKTCDIWQQKKLSNPKSNPIFKGPILIPLMAYLDRIMFRNKATSRSAPIIKHWNTKTLRERETNEIKYGGFGQGYLREAMEIFYSTTGRSPSVSNSESSEIDTAKKMKNAYTPSEKDSLLAFLKNHIDEGKVLAEGIRKYLDRLKTPEGLQLQSNGIFCKVNEAIDEMLKINVSSSSSQKSNESDETMSQQLFWTEACRCLDEIEKTKRVKEEVDLYDPSKSYENVFSGLSPIRTTINPRAGITS